MALLKSMFGGKPDAVLVSLRKIINENIQQDFPTKKIIEQYKNSTKDISIDDDFIKDKIEKSQYGSIDAYILLSLAINLDPQQRYNVDHMFPKNMFKKGALKEMPFLLGDENKFDFYNNKDNWNTVANLQLLNDSENKSKNKSKLADWVKRTKNYKWSDYLIPEDENGNYIVADESFIEFIEKRKKKLLERIKESLSM
jgi:hypothetical protein